MLRTLFSVFTTVLPWPLRRWALMRFLGYQIHPTARLGFCLLLARNVILEEYSRIGHLTVCIHLDLVHLGPHASLGRGNWITGYPSNEKKYFSHLPERRAELILGAHSAITNRHMVDCTARVTFGKFTTFAGFRSQILSHSIDLRENRQSAQPIEIGDYCFIGTDCVILGGCALPPYSVLAAKSLLNRKHEEQFTLYGGIPARPLKALNRDLKYFQRTTGHVD